MATSGSLCDLTWYATVPRFRSNPAPTCLSADRTGTGQRTREDIFEPYLDYLDRFQRTHHGFSLFDRAQTAARLRDSKGPWLAVARVEGTVVGIMTYEIMGDPRRMLVRSFYYDDYRGRYLLLDWFARHIDQVSEVELKLLPGELPETWLPDLTPQYRSGLAACRSRPARLGMPAASSRSPDCRR